MIATQSARWPSPQAWLAHAFVAALVLASSWLAAAIDLTAAGFQAGGLNPANSFASLYVQAPTSVATTVVSSGIQVSWSASPTAATRALDSYLVLRRPSGSGSYAQVGSVAGQTLSYTDTTAAGNATYDYAVQAKISTFTSPNSGTSTVVYDTMPPASVVSIPTSGEVFGSSSFTTSGTASDNLSGIAQVVVSVKSGSTGLYWNGTSWVIGEQWLAVTLGSPNTTSTSWSLSSGLPSGANLPNGSYTVRSRATDVSGNVETPGSGNTFTINTAAPTLTVTPSPALAKAGTVVTIVVVSNQTLKAAPAVSLTGACIATASVTMSPVGGQTNTWSGTYTVPSASTDCVATATATGTNQANIVGNGAATFTIDRLPPTTTASASGTAGTNGWYTGAVSASLGAADATSGVASSYYALDNAACTSTNLAACSVYSAPVAVSGEGTHTLYFFSKDVAGNFETQKSLAIKIDSVAPTAAVTSPAAGSSVSASTYSIAGTASDATSGLSLVQVSLKRNADGLYWSGTGWVGNEVWLGATGTTSWSLSSGLPTTSYGSHTTRSRATDLAGNLQTPGAGVSFTIVVPPPTLTATGAAGGAINLAWIGVSGVDGYNLYRSVVSGGGSAGYRLIATLSGASTASYQDTSTADGTTYYYVLRSRALDGSLSLPSNEASARADATKPQVSAVAPDDGVTNVALNAQVVVGFSEPMSQSATAAAFSLNPGGLGCGSGGTCAWSADGTTLTFTKSSSLAPSTTYTVGISTAARDMAGNALAYAFSSTFATRASGSDTTAPTIVSRSPAAGATNVGTNASVVVTFSEAMNTGATQAAFCVYPTSGTCAANRLAGTFTWSSAHTVLTFDLSGLLASSTQYTVSVTGGAGGAADVAGNVLSTTSTWSFTTTTQAAPYVVSTFPSDGETQVENNANIVINFSQAMSQTATQNAFCLFTDSPAGSGSCVTTKLNVGFAWSNGGTTLTVNPNANFTAGTRYRFTLSDTATASAAPNLRLANPLDVSFVAIGSSFGAKETGPADAMPGGQVTIVGSGWQKSNRRIEAHWDSPSGQLVGSTGPANCSGGTALNNWTITATIPFDATAGGHAIWLTGLDGTCTTVYSTTYAMTVLYPDQVTIAASDADLKLNPSGGAGPWPDGKTSTVTATVKKDGQPVAASLAGVVFTLVSNPAACAGGTLTPTGSVSTPLLTNASGQVTSTLTACTNVFDDMEVSVRTGNGLVASLTFLDPPVPPTDVTLDPTTSQLRWSPSRDARVAGYRVFVGTRSGKYDSVVDVGDVTAYELTLEPGRTYYAIVRSYTARHDSDPTAEFVFEAPMPTSTATATPTATETPTTMPTAIVTVAAPETPVPSRTPPTPRPTVDGTHTPPGGPPTGAAAKPSPPTRADGDPPGLVAGRGGDGAADAPVQRPGTSSLVPDAADAKPSVTPGAAPPPASSATQAAASPSPSPASATDSSGAPTASLPAPSSSPAPSSPAVPSPAATQMPPSPTPTATPTQIPTATTTPTAKPVLTATPTAAPTKAPAVSPTTAPTSVAVAPSG